MHKLALESALGARTCREGGAAEVQFPSSLNIGNAGESPPAGLIPAVQIQNLDKFIDLDSGLDPEISCRVAPPVTGAFVVSATNAKCIRVYGLVGHLFLRTST